MVNNIRIHEVILLICVSLWFGSFYLIWPSILDLIFSLSFSSPIFKTLLAMDHKQLGSCTWMHYPYIWIGSFVYGPSHSNPLFADFDLSFYWISSSVCRIFYQLDIMNQNLDQNFPSDRLFDLGPESYIWFSICRCVCIFTCNLPNLYYLQFQWSSVPQPIFLSIFFFCNVDLYIISIENWGHHLQRHNFIASSTTWISSLVYTFSTISSFDLRGQIIDRLFQSPR